MMKKENWLDRTCDFLIDINLSQIVTIVMFIFSIVTCIIISISAATQGFYKEIYSYSEETQNMLAIEAETIIVDNEIDIEGLKEKGIKYGIDNSLYSKNKQIVTLYSSDYKSQVKVHIEEEQDGKLSIVKIHCPSKALQTTIITIVLLCLAGMYIFGLTGLAIIATSIVLQIFELIRKIYKKITKT